MSLLGDLFGYNRFGNDMIGYPQDPSYGCVACGLADSAHTEEMRNTCMRDIWARPNEPEKKDL